MAPLPSNERVKALAIVDGKIAAWVVGTGPSGAGEPWVEQWFFFEEVGSDTYSDYPDLMPALVDATASASAPLPEGHPPLSARPGRLRHAGRKKLRATLADIKKARVGGAKPKAVEPPGSRTEYQEITWITIAPSDPTIGQYHGYSNPVNDDPEAFFDHGLKDLIDEFGQHGLDGPIGYVFGETHRLPDQDLTDPSWLQPLCDEGGGSPEPKVARIYRGELLVGYVYSKRKSGAIGEWSHRRGVHQFIVDGVQVHVPNTNTKMKRADPPAAADWSTPQDFAAWLASDDSDWPKKQAGGPEECDYYYGCAYVTLDCDPDQNFRPQTPAQYPGS